jgi:hypothetical protein
VQVRSYTVLERGRKWAVRLNGVELQQYPSAWDAVRASIDSAHTDGGMGYDAFVALNRGEFWQLCWRYGDQYPPVLADLSR